jgi:hypothetical protein
MIANDLRYSLLISISVHAGIVWWLFSTIPVPVSNNRISQQQVMNVTLFSDVSTTSEDIKKHGVTSPTRKSQSSVKKSQPVVTKKSEPESGVTKPVAGEATEKGRAESAPTGESGFQLEGAPDGGGIAVGPT